METIKMSPRPILERWAAMLRPLFPAHAEFDLKPRHVQFEARWPPHRAVAIFISPNAVEHYRNAEAAVRIRADQNLLAFVKENLRRFSPVQDDEFKIVVASVDFVPLR